VKGAPSCAALAAGRVSTVPITGTPRSVKIFAIVAAVLVVIFGIVHLIVGGLADHVHEH
jgi:hypothetical protein